MRSSAARRAACRYRGLLRFCIGLSGFVKSPYAQRDKNSERSELNRKSQRVAAWSMLSP
jgi:hypothetical protein